ncbi:hypothetical protein [Actinomadura litoris]|uniref:hypothetical protein n=1 Tax=Actinomadura litoris TaxID=2678616 RepID=UPI001FA72ED1|nr:hypothetical protein [Actinomadura litoris]
MTDASTRPLPKGCQIGCLAAVALIAIFLAWAWVVRGSSSDAGGVAVSVCEGFVKKGLKAPASARFSGEHASEDAGVWTVRGSVDSQNAFGALIRNSFSCSVRPRGDADETWDLVSMSGLEN